MQLVGRSLSTAEIRGSNPIIGNCIYSQLYQINWIEKIKRGPIFLPDALALPTRRQTFEQLHIYLDIVVSLSCFYLSSALFPGITFLTNWEEFIKMFPQLIRCFSSDAINYLEHDKKHSNYNKSKNKFRDGSSNAFQKYFFFFNQTLYSLIPFILPQLLNFCLNTLASLRNMFHFQLVWELNSGKSQEILYDSVLRYCFIILPMTGFEDHSCWHWLRYKCANSFLGPWRQLWKQTWVVHNLFFFYWKMWIRTPWPLRSRHVLANLCFVYLPKYEQRLGFKQRIF